MSSQQDGLSAAENGAGIEMTSVKPSLGTSLFAASRRDVVAKAIQSASAGDKEGSTGNRLGTMKGVFLPTLQNILGVILFLRLPFITAQAGTWLSSAIVLLSVASTIPTALSMSAIATNGRIPAGGPYYVVSRNLGPAYGGAVGILFYLGTTLAATLYVLGAIEAFQSSFDLQDQFSMDTELEAIGLMFVMATVVWLGVEYVNKVAFLFLAAVLISIVLAVSGLVAFGGGADFGVSDSIMKADKVSENFGADYEKDPDTGLTPSFTSLIALFYPSVTGIMAGSNRSGLLADPSRSIPKGTLGAIAVTTFLYILTIWLFGTIISNETLKNEKFVVAEIAFPVPIVVQLGVLMSSIGAGLQSLVGAPQLLQTIVEDDLFPFLRWLRLTAKEDDTHTKDSDKILEGARARAGTADSAIEEATLEDVRIAAEEVDVEAAKPAGAGWKAVWLTFVLAALPCLSGNLDFITPFVTMFFLMMYATVNLACFVLTVIRAPNFRPTWKYFHWSSCLFGVVICVVLMFLAVEWWQAVAVLFLAALLYKVVQHFSTKNAGSWGDWGDALTGLRLEQARTALLALRGRPVHPKNWRPQLLVLTATTEAGLPEKPNLLSLASQLKHGKGLTLLASARQGSLLRPADVESARAAEQRLAEFSGEIGLEAFTHVVVANNVMDCLRSLCQASGLGALEPNAVMVGWPTKWRANPAQTLRYVDLMKSIKNSGKTLVVAKPPAGFPAAVPDPPLTGTIDIWWFVHDGGILLLLPYLLTRSQMWRLCKLRLFSVDRPSSRPANHREVLTEYLRSVRINAEVIIVDIEDEAETADMVQRTLTLEARRQMLDEYKAVTMTLMHTKEAAELAKTARTAAATASMPKPSPKPKPAMDRKRSTLASLFQAPTADELKAEETKADVPDTIPEAAEADAPASPGPGPTAAAAAAPPATPASLATPSKADDGSGQKQDPREAAILAEAQAALAALAEDKAAADPAHPRVDANLGTAVRLNKRILEWSKKSNLVVTNLPLTTAANPSDFLEYVEALTEDLDRVLLVRGSGTEVVTGFA